MTEVITNQQFNHLAEEIAQEVIEAAAQMVFERNVDLVKGYWHIGRAFISNPNYKKYGKQQGKLFETVAKITGRGERSLRYAVEFYSKHPGDVFEEALPEVEGGKSPIWRDIVKSLPSGKQKVEKQTCAHEWVCSKCGATKK